MSDFEFCAHLDVMPYFGKLANYKKCEEFVLKCEELGYDSAWLCDHLFWGSGPLLECWTTLSALAAVTKKIRLGTLVTCNSFRHPSILAKMAANVDLISEGRLEFGIGAGWKEDEYRAYGLPFPRPAIRIGQMKEAVIIIKKMWSEKSPSFKGKYYEIKNAICEPKPIQKPWPPIWIGGSGEQLTLRVVAEHANACNMFGSPPEYERKLKILRKHCEAVGRNYNDIKKSWIADLIIARNKKELAKKIKTISPTLSSIDYNKRGLIGTPDECIDKIQKYIDIGVTCFTPHMKSGLTEDAELFYDEVVKAFK